MRLPSLLKSSPATVLWCGPNSRASPALSTTSAILPTDAAIAPVARWAASLSIHLPFLLAISVAPPSRARRSRRPSSPPETKPSLVGSPISDSTAPLWRGSVIADAGCLMSADNRRTRPSPSPKPTVAPSRLKAQAAMGASHATERVGGSVVCHAGFPRSSFTPGLLEAVFEAALQVIAVEIAADEDELARALLARLPRRAPARVHHHVHALVDVALGRAVDRQDALAAEDVRPLDLQERAHPLLELVGIDRLVGGDRQALHLFLMIVVVAVLEEVGFELEDAVQVERALVEDGRELDLALLGLVDARVGIDRVDLVLDLLEVVGAHQVELVEQDHVGEGHLFLRFGALAELAEEVLGVDHGHDRVEARPGLHVVVGEEGLRNGAGIGEAGGLDQDAVELVLAFHQPFDDADQVAAHGAADAAVVHLEHFLVGVHHEVVVDAQLAELVHDHGVFLAVLLTQNPVEQRGLSGAEIAGQHGHGHLRLSHRYLREHLWNW